MSKWYSFKELKQARTPMLLDSVTGLPDNHVITVVERVISVDDPELIQNNVRTDTFTLNLDAEYDDLNVVVIFTKPNNINVKVAYNGTPTHIPGSAMELVGSLACSVVGIDADGEVRAVTKAAPDTFQVVKSGAYDGSVTSDDAELLGQILQAVSDAEAAITEAETATTAATNATNQATSAATSANKAASSANSAASSANSAATRATSAAVNAENAYDTLQPYMATIDSCANVLHREVGPDSVVTADDSFPCKPVEMVVYGNTVQNLWVNPATSTKGGITLTSNSDGSITLSGTSTTSSEIYFEAVTYALKPGTSYTLSVDKTLGGGGAAYFCVIEMSDTGEITRNTVGNDNKEKTFGTSVKMVKCLIWFRLMGSGITVSGTYRVMLNEGSTAEPWCPPGLNSVGQLREDEKNLWKNPSGTQNGLTVTDNDDGSASISGTVTNTTTIISSLESVALSPSTRYTARLDKSSGSQTTHGFSIVEYSSDGGKIAEHYFGQDGDADLTTSFTTLSNCASAKCCFTALAGATVSGTYKAMLNRGSTAQPWVAPGLESMVQVVTAGKNICDTSGMSTTRTLNGVTFTNNGDGSFSASGTATAGTSYTLADNASLSKYLVPGMTVYVNTKNAQYNANTANMSLKFNQGANKPSQYIYDGSGIVPKYVSVKFEFWVGSGTTVDLENVYPYVLVGSEDAGYVPFDSRSCVTTIPLKDSSENYHTLNALPDGTRDELHIDGGGNVVLEKRCGDVDKDFDWALASTNFGTVTTGLKDAYRELATSGTHCAQGFKVTDSGNTSDWPDYTCGVASPGPGLYQLYVKTVAGNDLAASKQAIVNQNGRFIYRLKEPQTIDLGTITPPTMAAPNVTAYVADDTPAEMELDYVRDINIVVDRLEKKVADLVVTEATIV